MIKLNLLSGSTRISCWQLLTLLNTIQMDTQNVLVKLYGDHKVTLDELIVLVSQKLITTHLIVPRGAVLGI